MNWQDVQAEIMALVKEVVVRAHSDDDGDYPTYYYVVIGDDGQPRMEEESCRGVENPLIPDREVVLYADQSSSAHNPYHFGVDPAGCRRETDDGVEWLDDNEEWMKEGSGEYYAWLRSLAKETYDPAHYEDEVKAAWQTWHIDR